MFDCGMGQDDPSLPDSLISVLKIHFLATAFLLSLVRRAPNRSLTSPFGLGSADKRTDHPVLAGSATIGTSGGIVIFVSFRVIGIIRVCFRAICEFFSETMHWAEWHQ